MGFHLLLLPLLSFILFCMKVNSHILISNIYILFTCTGKTIVRQFRSSLKDNAGDIHARLMSHYLEAPEWWYVLQLFCNKEPKSMCLWLGTLFCLVSRLYLEL